MGYILKTNNRKKLSGSTLQAKIVSPDKKDVVYREYPVEVQIQTLSDRECVLRDMQQLDAILSQNNNWANITKINELNSALQSASNGSTFILREFVPDSDDNGKIIDADGTILRQPMYSTSQSTSDFSSTLHITVKKGSVVEEYTKDFVVPAYTADSILGNIKLLFNNNSLWSLIKNVNEKQKNIHSNLSKINVDTLFNQQASSGVSTNSMFDAEDANAKPALTMTYPNYYTSALVTEDSQSANVTKIEASNMYQLSPSQYRIEAVKANELTADECTGMSINKTYDRGEIVGYRMYSTNASDNIISGKFTLTGATLPCEATVSNVGFLSKKVRTQDISDNILGSALLSWFIPTYALTSYNISDAPANTSDTTSSRKSITIPKDEFSNQLNPVLKISGTLLDMLQDTDIVDATHIGYSYDHANNILTGFSNSMINVKVQLTSGQMHVSTEQVDTTQEIIDAATQPLVSSYTAASANDTVYLYLDGRNEFTSKIEGVITIELLQTSLGSSTTAVTFYFELNPTT